MDLNTSGIYKLNFSNGKVYIGMSCNIRRRMKEHRSDINSKNSMPVHRAMKVHDYTIEILEHIEDRKTMQEAERKWIKYYKSNDRNYGYNLALGGDGSGSGINNHQAKFDENTIQEIYTELSSNTDIYIYEIANKYNISQEAISEINNGIRYFSADLTYPLRKPPKMVCKEGVEHHNAKLEKKDLEEIIILLKGNNVTFNEIGEMYNCSYTTISKLNRGLSYFDKDIDYPIRKNHVKTNSLNQEQVLDVINLLINTNFTMEHIAKIFNVSKDTISRLNAGKTYINKDYIYPIRKNKSDNKAVSTILESEE